MASAALRGKRIGKPGRRGGQEHVVLCRQADNSLEQVVGWSYTSGGAIHAYANSLSR